jgi:hypothetical protein
MENDFFSLVKVTSQIYLQGSRCLFCLIVLVWGFVVADLFSPLGNLVDHVVKLWIKKSFEHAQVCPRWGMRNVETRQGMCEFLRRALDQVPLHGPMKRTLPSLTLESSNSKLAAQRHGAQKVS